MAKTTPKPDLAEVADAPEARIVAAARDLFFAVGYGALTVDALAEALGMSKKTIYRHFRSKEAILAAVIDEAERTIRTQAQALIADPRAAFAAKLGGVMEIVSAQYGRMRPERLRELAQAAPALHRRIETLRRRTTPAVVGALLRAGIEADEVRAGTDVDFAVEMWIAAASGLLDPQTLDRLGLSPREAISRGIDLFFLGVLKTKPRNIRSAT